MESNDDDVGSSEDNILYDFTIQAEWQQEPEVFTKGPKDKSQVSMLGRVSSATQRSLWTSLRIVGVPMQSASPCSLPAGLLKLINSEINWHIAVGRNAEVVAILQDQCVEIRSNNNAYETVVGRGAVPRDPYPQWRCLAWSADNSMVACSQSDGTVEVFDIFGTRLFTIQGEAPNENGQPLELSCAVAGMVFTDTIPNPPWSAELLVVNYHGSLHKYLVGRDNGYEAQHSFLFNQQYPLGISCVEYHAGAQLLLVGGTGCDDNQSPSQSRQEGLTAWRILSGSPHYKLVTDYQEDLHQSKQGRSIFGKFKASLRLSSSGNQDGIYKMCLSPDSKMLAAIHHSGKLTLWHIPSLKQYRTWAHDEQPYSEEYSPDFTDNPQKRKILKDLVSCKNLIDVNWWNNEAVTLSRGTGAVTVSSSSTLKNLLGTSPEWFEPSSRVTAVHDGGFLGLEVENKFRQKRRLVSEEENDDSDEEEDSRWVSTFLTKNVLSYFRDTERFQPPRKRPNCQVLTIVQAVTLSRGTGAVTVSSSSTLKNLLGTSPEWFEPSSRVTAVHDGGFLGLEVENKFRQKRRLVSEEENDDSDEEEDSRWVSTFLTKNVLSYFRDTERFQPPRKRPKMVNRTYRLVCLKSTTPEELYTRKIDLEEYGEALGLAKAYNLDSDKVYQRQWRKSEVSKASIQDYLSKIKKRGWVLHECLERMPENIDAMKELLEFGLRGTDLQALIAIGKGEDGGRFILCDPEEGLYADMSLDEFDPDTERVKEEMKEQRMKEFMEQVDFSNLNLEQKELCRVRFKLLQYLDRLRTYELILGGEVAAVSRFNDKFFEKFRSQNIVEAAVNYARQGDWKALESLFIYHGETLKPHRLAVLSNFPETTCPTEYREILPEIVDDSGVLPLEENSWRDTDWCETPQCRCVVEPLQIDLGEFLYEDHPKLSQFRCDEMPAELLTRWYRYRAFEIEAMSLQVEHAISLVKLAVERGVQGLTDLLDNLVTMEMLVYDCHIEDTLTFEAVTKMADYEKLELIMSKSTEEMYVKNLHRWLVPFLMQCERQNAGSYNTLLRDYIVTMAKTDLSLVLKVFESSKANLPNPVIKSQDDVMSMAMEAVYSCEREDQLHLHLAIFQCLPSKQKTGTRTQGKEAQKLYHQVDMLKQQLSAAKILESHGVTKPLHYLKETEADAEEAKNLMVRLTRNAGKREKPLDQKEWRSLHEDVLNLQNEVYKCLSPGLCHEIFTESVLCSSSRENITMAGGPLGAGRVQKVNSWFVLEFINITKSLTSEQLVEVTNSFFKTKATKVCVWYKCLSVGLCHEIFTESVLCSSSRENITMAGDLLERESSESEQLVRPGIHQHHKVPYERAVELVISAAREYFNSSSNLMDPCMDLARACLNLIRETPLPSSIQEELDLIGSLALLDDFNVSVLPLQVRLSDNRLDLVRQAVRSKPTSFRQRQKLLRLGHLLRVSGDERLLREGQVLHLIAEAAVKGEDFLFAFEVCEDLMSQCYGNAWNTCVDLAWQEKFTDMAAKAKLLSFSVTYCTPDMIEPILQAKALLETQILHRSLNTDVQGEMDEGSSTVEVPLSARAALKQTKNILTSTTKSTKALLSTMADKNWWHGTMDYLTKSSKQSTSMSDRSHQDENQNFERQGCHPFYCDAVENAYLDLNAIDYQRCQSDDDLSTEMSLLRAVYLEEMLTEGEKTQSTSQVLLKIAYAKMTADSTLGLAFLLALPQEVTDHDHFADFPFTTMSLQMALYYFALQIYSSIKPTFDPELSLLYKYPPFKLIEKVRFYISRTKDAQRPREIIQLVKNFKQYQEFLEDSIQAKQLKKLDRGIDTGRFTKDSQYRVETICGLAMTLEENVYNISLSLATRYAVSLWDVYMAHLEFLFSDSMLTTEEIEDRVGRMGILAVLKERGGDFVGKMSTYVYPSVEGTDHARLLYYYTLMSGIDTPLAGTLTADTHVKLLKKIKFSSEGLDYKRLVEGKHNPVDVLVPILTTSNINVIAKLANKIPDGKGGFLMPSAVYCAWAIKMFWDTSKKVPDSGLGWVHRYESCQETLQKLLPQDLIQFVDSVVFVPQSREMVGSESRQQILNRCLKFARQQGSKKKKQEELGDQMNWEEAASVLKGYQSHLTVMQHPALQSLVESEADNLRQYSLELDMSKGKSDKLEEIFVKMTCEGLAIDMIEKLLSSIPTLSWKSITAVRQSITVIISHLSDESSSSECMEENLASFQRIVNNVFSHGQEGGDRVTAEDVMTLVRPFCSDDTVAVKPRLDLLHILEKSFDLSPEDMVLLTLYRSEAVINKAWQAITVQETDINTDQARFALFTRLLSLTTSFEQTQALYKLLHLWPPLTASNSRVALENPWVNIFDMMVQKSNKTDQTLVCPCLREVLSVCPLSKECVQHIYDSLVATASHMEAVRCALIGQYKDLMDTAIEHLASQPQVVADDELLDLIVRNNLVNRVVLTHIYPAITDYILANQNTHDESHDYLSVEVVCRRLREEGFEAEAGSLLMKSHTSHPLLQTFSASLQSLKKWF
ncbi:neuroblastoma-amplified sequence-like [Pecten maximus]|uniref:neuroblastoma-amplified sequence-like n=1 Tax=Pecten maximus TaxID=6579 RepID=UPI0014580169|nr:neuroblastoma-amplified sequence-like [Pecten maximus]